MSYPNFPNSPLGEAVFEVRFPGHLGMYAAWGNLQAELAGEFPKLYVPTLQPGEAPALKPCRLASQDQNELLLLSLNAFAYSARKYQNFDHFRGRFLELWGKFLRSFTPTTITRVGLRYQNWLPSEFPGMAPVPGQLHGCLRLALDPLASTFKSLVSIESSALQLDLQLEDFKVRVALAPPAVVEVEAPFSVPMVAGTLFDIDCWQAGEFSLDSVLARLEAAHQHVDEAFFGLINQQYYAYLRGEVQDA